MIRTLLVIFLFSIFLTSVAQDSAKLLDGYYTIDKIDLLLHSQKTSEARKLFMSEKLDKQLTPYQCFYFADAFIETKDTILSRRLVNDGFSKGVGWNWLTPYPKLKKCLTFSDSLYYSNTIREAKCKMDVELYAQLSAMSSTDQYIRGKWLHTHDTVFLRAMKEVDSLNANAVFKIIDKYGWLGHNTYPLEEKLFPIFLHVTSERLDSTHFESYKKQIYQEVLKGRMLPSTYAIWVDRYCVFNLKKPQVYGTFWKRTDKGKELEGVQNPEVIDKTRRSIGLISLREYLEINKENIKPDWYNIK